MRADELNRHTHAGRTVEGYDYGGVKRRISPVYNVIHEDGWVFICHEKHAARKFHPSAEVSVS